ncbi:hypothetical protein M153_11600012151 [Pseudoloma neurophilia]|uniref:Uncharacterized protein n=1 Tax=Pseudoloma neurophilia TaxID=146866 RepID=A0A0R0M9A6_9MICR|nr:hypothetical protein M153_11600012151 [Pseudoloma neurophilia]
MPFCFFCAFKFFLIFFNIVHSCCRKKLNEKKHFYGKNTKIRIENNLFIYLGIFCCFFWFMNFFSKR